jgi:membrane-bound serine protease (ClpP class)
MMNERRVGLRSTASMVLVAALLVVWGGCADRAVEPMRDGVVYRVPVTGVIELGLAPFIERSLAEARAANAAAVVLDIDTPGGRVDAAQRIVKALQDAEIPTYALVNPHAFSAGAMIALATDRVYMRPGSVMGAATPVTGEGQTAPEKIVSAMRAEMRSLAERRGLDPRVAEAMVDETIAVEGVVEEGKLLTLTAVEAERIGYALLVADFRALLADVGIADGRVVDTRPNWAEGVVRFITNPLVAPFLLSLGFLGLIIEIKTPTFGLAGIAGGTALALFFGGHYLVGLAGWEELILLTVGLVLLGIEIFVVPGFGVFGVLGIGGILASIYLSMIGSMSTIVDYTNAAMVLSASMLIVLVSGWAIMRTLPKNMRLYRSGILLGEVTGRETGYLSATVRGELVGRRGVAVTDLRPAGVGRFDGERIDIVAEEGWLTAGTAIEIVRAEGYRHVVRSAESTETARKR